MSIQTEYEATFTKLQQLAQENTAGVPDVKLEKFYQWIQSQCCYLEREQQPFTVTERQAPQTLTVANYNFLVGKLGPIPENHYTFDGIKYVRNGTPMSNADATALYCTFYLKKRNIVWVDFGFNIGKEFGGKHPAIILKNLNNDVLIVAPVSTNVDGRHSASDTEVIFSGSDMYDMPSVRERFTHISRVTPVSVYRIDTSSTVASLRREKFQELIQKIKNNY